MNIRHLLATAAIVAAAQTTYAQYAQDAVRFSSFNTGSTARIKGIGNAGTAIGGDLSSISGNPAGTGFFTHSELSITPEYNGSNVNAGYFGSANTANKSALNLNNASVLFYSKLNSARGADKTQGWLSLNFGIAYARTNNFYQNTYYNGQNNQNNIAQYYAAQANQFGVNGGLAGWAYDQNLIDFYNSANAYKSNVVSGTVGQSRNVVSTGGQSEINLSLGTNYSNKLYLGLGMGIASIRYNMQSAFVETGTASVFENNNTTTANRAYNSTFSQDQQSRGTGVNLKLGFIYKPVEAVRIGGSLTTPTWYKVDDNYNEGLRTTLNNGFSGSNGDNYPYTYNFRTPLKLAGGIAFFLGKYGFITGDVEYQDYSSIHLDYDTDQQDNNDIKRLYRSVVNARVGAELKLDQLYFRGGYGTQGNPMKSESGNMNTATAGIGYRFGSYFIDAAYSHITNNSTVYPPYDLTTNYGASMKSTYDNVFLTLGLRF
ncbi:hypothetical protein MUY27_17240 [Mucilaginibacter sp. RS28]|uniref:Long-chain fatty acid transport protein n=1 Tax=Mucilaginibacter straminoryzae TaxID=2932774 RepID=A0A9X1X5H7_9SPHI|nr:hypothetical protein [Mucilaginibacter straminoryzae]MCJ8211467.1 hypothetical protein [Mucilaginibacter straminoryzae]